jgi:hypothetical protein
MELLSGELRGISLFGSKMRELSATYVVYKFVN